MVQQRVEPTEHDNEYKIRQFCSEAVQDIERMNAQIRRLQSTLDSITQKRDTLQRQVSVYRRSIAPPIPVEILQHIFRSCVELFPVISSSGCVEAPVLLTHVCSQWRSIALDTPDLWSAMHVVVPSHNVFRFASKRRRILETIGAFIKRSRDLPLHISVYSGLFYKHIFETELIPEDREDFDAIVEVLETLVIYSRRWKYLKLLIPFHCYNRATSRLKSEHVPQLETAMVAGRGVDFLLNAPRLRQLALQYPTHPYFFAPDSLSLDGEMWGRLHTLKLNVSLANLAIGTHEMFPILEGCPNLRECMLDLGFLNRPILGRAPAQRILVLPHLKELHLIDARANNILGTILSQLSAPTLESFSLFNTPISHFRMDGETLTHVNEFLERSSCSLLKLLLVMCQSPDLKSNEFVQFLRGIHGTLQNLIMESRADEDTYFMNDDILRALTVHFPPQDVLCPKLTRMVFSDGGSISERTLHDFVSARVFTGQDVSDPSGDTSDGLSEIKPLKHLLVYTRQTGFASRFIANASSNHLEWSAEKIEVVEEVDIGQETNDTPTYFKAFKESYGPSTRDVDIYD